jgi:phytoene synthase
VSAIALAPTLADAYQTCEETTRTQARNFHYGIRLLPRDKRQALCAVYALARRVDDIGDGDMAEADKRAALIELRAAIRDSEASTDPVLLAVSDAARRMPIPMEAFDELIDGVEMDLAGTRYATFDELVTYCRCVAGTVGRLCVGVFGASDQQAAPGYADQLGIALQQTNILRDIREDLVNGRVYLPADELDQFDVELRLDAAGALVDDGGLSALIRHSAERARTWYADGLRLVPLLDRRSAASAIAMSGIYRELLDRIAAQPTLVLDQRLSLSGWTKAGVAARALAGRSA